MAVAERSASIVWHGDLREGSGELQLASGAMPTQTMTFSARTEGAERKTSPEELIAAAHATCYAMSLANTLKTETGAAPDRLEVSAACVLDRVEGGLKITTMRLRARAAAAGLDAARFQDLAATAERRCPVSNALRASVQIELDAALA